MKSHPERVQHDACPKLDARWDLQYFHELLTSTSRTEDHLLGPLEHGFAFACCYLREIRWIIWPALARIECQADGATTFLDLQYPQIAETAQVEPSESSADPQSQRVRLGVSLHLAGRHPYEYTFSALRAEADCPAVPARCLCLFIHLHPSWMMITVCVKRKGLASIRICLHTRSMARWALW